MSALTDPAITRTELYPFVPNGVATSQCECLDSLLRRLALAHTVAYPALVKHVYKTHCSSKRPFRFATRDYRRSLLFNSPLLSSVAEAIGRDEVKLCTLNTFDRLINFSKCMDVTMNRHCPICVAENLFPSAWYPIVWCIGPVEACPMHHVLFVSSGCGYPRDRWLPVVQRCFVPGVCRHCGSIGFRCSNSAVKNATDIQIWVADQVGALVAAATNGEEFNPLAMKAALRKIVLSRWGTLVAAARFLEVDESLFRHPFKPGARFGLQLLLALCSSVEVDVLDVLRGNGALAAPIGAPYVMQELWSIKKYTKGLSEDEIEKLTSRP